MSALLALPNEILLEIIEDVSPDDLLNFALSCKRILSLSQNCLKLHGERKETYATIKLYGCPRHDNDAHPSTLLRDISNDWRIAFYLRSMTIICCDCRGTFIAYNEHKEAVEGSDDEDDEDSEDDGDTKDTRDAGEAKDVEGNEPLERVIKGFESAIIKKIHETENPRDQASKVKEWGIGKRDAMLGLLLIMLPNLEDLTLGQYTWGANTFRTILWNIVEANLDPDHTGPIILPKLKDVLLVSSDSYHCEDAEIMGCFALLPSVKMLRGSGVESARVSEDDDWVTSADDIDYRWRRPDDHTSAVTAIVFQESAISFGYFSQLLRGITKLRKFIYGFNGVPIGTDPYRLIDLLLLHSRTTLEYLELQGFASEQFDLHDGAGNGSLRDFEVLENVCVHSGLWTVHEGYGRVADLEEDSESEEATIIPLVDALPSCIKTVQLEGAIHMKDVDRLLSGLTGPKGRRLHSLRRVVFCNVESPSSSLGEVARTWKEGCAEMGVSLEFEWAT